MQPPLGFNRPLTWALFRSHLDDDGRILLGGIVHGGFSVLVSDVGAGLALVQQLLHARQVATFARPVQRRLTQHVPRVDLAESRNCKRFDILKYNIGE